MKPRIYFSKECFDNYSILFKLPKKLHTSSCRGVVELLHCSECGDETFHCCWVDSIVGEYNGKFVRYEDAPKAVRERVDYLYPIWNKACKTEDFSEWNGC